MLNFSFSSRSLSREYTFLFLFSKVENILFDFSFSSRNWGKGIQISLSTLETGEIVIKFLFLFSIGLFGSRQSLHLIYLTSSLPSSPSPTSILMTNHLIGARRSAATLRGFTPSSGTTPSSYAAHTASVHSAGHLARTTKRVTTEFDRNSIWTASHVTLVKDLL